MSDPWTQCILALESNTQDTSDDDDALQEMQQAFLSDDIGDDDMDRQDMLFNYASDSYLQRWSQDVEGGKEIESTAVESSNQDQMDLKVFITEKNSVTEGTRLDSTADGDGISLVSYNSVQDGKPGLVSRTSTELHRSPYLFDIGRQTASAWQGYGGHIYFNPLKCQSLRILAGKPAKTCLQKTSEKELDGRQGHAFQQKQQYKPPQKGRLPTVNRDIVFVQYPVDSHLGSLRMDRTPRQRKCRSKLPRQQNQKGKLCKGLSERIVLEILQKGVSEPIRCVSAPEPLDAPGLRRQTRYSISESIKDFKNYSKARSEQFELLGRNSFPVLFSSEKMVPRTNGQILESLSLPTLTDKRFESSMTSSNRSIQNCPVTHESAQDSKPVLIIPFGAFDDPVNDHDSDISFSLKKKQTQEKLKKNTKSVTVSNQTKSNILHEKEMNGKETAKKRTSVYQQTKSRRKAKQNEKQDFPKSVKLSKESDKEFSTEVDTRIFVRTSDGHGEPKKVAPHLSFEDSNRCQNSTNGKKHHSKDQCQTVTSCNSRNKSKQTTTTTLVRDSHLKREISNASLSSYLSAAPSHTTQVSNTRQKDVPKLSYTKRVKPLSLQSNNGYFDSKPNSVLDDQIVTNHSDFEAEDVTFRHFEGRHCSSERSPSKQLKLILSLQETDNYQSSSGSRNLNKVETTSSTLPQRGFLKRTAKSTKSSLGVKFTVDSPNTASRPLVISGREYLVPVTNRKLGTQ